MHLSWPSSLQHHREKEECVTSIEDKGSEEEGDNADRGYSITWNGVLCSSLFFFSPSFTSVLISSSLLRSAFSHFSFLSLRTRIFFSSELKLLANILYLQVYCQFDVLSLRW